MPDLRKLLLLATLGILAVLPKTALARRGSERWTNRQTQIVDEVTQAEIESQDLVGVAVGVVKQGRVVFTKGYGLADRKRQIPVSDQTVFNWASNSKPLVAVLAMQLAEKDQLDLDADVRDYVPEFPDKRKTITTRQLLCHQSGIPHYKNGLVIPLPVQVESPLADLDPVVALRRFGASPLIFPPGQRYEYSSHAYVLLSAVVQRAGGQPIEEQIAQRITDPLEMKSFQLDLPAKDQPHWTMGYKRNRQGSVATLHDQAHFWKHGAGGYKSNIVDFATWAAALTGNQLLSKKTRRQMWTPQPRADGQLTSYGLGFRISNHPSNMFVFHGGAQDETRTFLLVNPQLRQGLVVLCNSGHADPEKIVRAIFEKLRS